MSISVVIPTRNAGPEFARTLEMVHAQRVTSPVEILVVDTASSDGTVELCRERGVRVLGIEPHQFNHGLTRNYAITKTGGEYVALLVQDAVPATDTWLQRMAEHLDRDPDVAGVTGPQEPRPDADPVVRWELAYRARRLGDKTQVLPPFDPGEFEALDLEDRIYRCAFDNVNAMVRRSVWSRYPFQPLSFAEDMDWARRVLEGGSRLVYEPDASVVHSHDRPPLYHLKRHYVGAKVIPSIMNCLPSDFSSETDASLLGHVLRSVRECTDAAEAVRAGDAARVSGADLSALLGVADFDPADSADPLRHQLFHVLRLLFADGRAWPGPVVADILGQVVARAIGVMLGHYYYYCQVHGRISPTLALLNGSLSTGV
jgi:GT2 family glycosyltransferase